MALMPMPRLQQVGNAGARFLRRLDAALMPVVCVFCGEPLAPQAVPVCPGCYADLPRTSGSGLVHGLRVHAPLRYEFPVDAAIKALKFGRKLWYVPLLAALMAEEIDTLPPDIDAVLPVPLHWRRRFLRGFNQAEELYRPLRSLLRLPLPGNVHRRRHTPEQSGLDARARRRNVSGAFQVRGRLAMRHVLLIDDVVTTGATCAALARALGDAGVGEVTVLAAARAN